MFTTEQLEALTAQLNEEYAAIGTITISSAEVKEIYLKNLTWISGIMDEVEPLENMDPIIVHHIYGDRYGLVDGYHRLKWHLGSREAIQVVCIGGYNIRRKHDTLFEFLENQVGKDVSFLQDHVFTLDGKTYFIKANEGCGGCSNGWSSLTVDPSIMGTVFTIEKVEQHGTDREDEYQLFINSVRVADVDTGYGNGYYGGDFDIELIS